MYNKNNKKYIKITIGKFNKINPSSNHQATRIARANNQTNQARSFANEPISININSLIIKII